MTAQIESTTGITDEQSLVGAKYGLGQHDLDIWDDGFGPLWIYRESLGPCGIVRAKTWEDAYNCVIDEIMDDADPEDPENHPNKDGNLPEGIHYRGSGVPSNPRLKSPMAYEDLNGSILEPLTDRLSQELNITLVLE